MGTAKKIERKNVMTPKEGTCPYCNIDLILDKKERKGDVLIECPGCEASFEIDRVIFKKKEKETMVLFYNSEISMQRGISKMQKDGWGVESTETIRGNYEFGKTCCLGLIFLPLALLGKGRDKLKVTFSRK